MRNPSPKEKIPDAKSEVPASIIRQTTRNTMDIPTTERDRAGNDVPESKRPALPQGPPAQLGIVSDERIRDIFNELIARAENAMAQCRERNAKFEFAAMSGFADGVKEMSALLLNDDSVRDQDRL